ncbi:MAG TPA: ATP-binding protein [Polyangiaceae bacterium]|nr:ATP-binding protein [Polyangiaceae bacterium]
MTGIASSHGELNRKELARKCAELEFIVDAIPALVVYKDTARNVLHANRAATEMAALAAGRWSWDGPEHREADLQVIASGEPKVGVVEPMDVPGLGKRWFDIARLPQLDHHGRVQGIVVVAQDITDRRQLEDRLLQAQKLESIGRLAGGVAHDFNNLLTSIFGLIKLTQREVAPDSMAHEYLALLNLTAEGGANLTRQLLAFARRQMIEPQLVDLNGLVHETANLLERVLAENIELKVETSSQSLPVKVDPSQVSQLLLNLALNARDAMPSGGRLTFRTWPAIIDASFANPLPGASAGRYAVISVRDTGQGLTDAAREHLFEPFFTTKTIGKGTGLGLAMCYGIVKQNGGHIAVESERGVGTTFIIYLPERDAAIEPARPEPAKPRVEAGHETLLFVEDDDLLRSLIVPELARSGYRVIEASNGEEALKAATEHAGPIHLLITDLVMPKLGGVELARRFKQSRPQASVLFISGYTSEVVNDGDPYVSLVLKPFSNETLLARIQQLLETTRSAP